MSLPQTRIPQHHSRATTAATVLACCAGVHRRTLQALLALILLAVLAPLAWGHASLVRASPAAGSVLQQAPDAVVLVFNEPVSVTRVGLVAPDGTALPVSAQASGDTVRVMTLAPQGAQGTYLLSWRIVSADGHPVGGTLDYAVGHASAHDASAMRQRGRGAAIWLARWLTYLGLFAAVGAGLFRTMAPRRRTAWVPPVVGVTALLLLLDLGLQGLDLLDAPALAALGPSPWLAALGSTYTLTLSGMALALAAAWVAARARAGLLQMASASAALALTAVAVSLSGHAGTAPPPWLARPLVATHVALALAWFGCLVPLALHLRASLVGKANAGTALALFSGWIAPAVAMLVITGVGLAALQLSSPSDLLHTSYGRVLLAKLALVAALLCLAAVNRWYNTPGALAGQRAARHRLVRVTGAEVVLAMALLAVVSLWRLTPPPLSLAAQAPVPAQVFELHGQQLRARVVGNHRGAWQIDIRDAGGQPQAAERVRLAISSPEHGIEPLWADAHQEAVGHWQVSLPVLPVPAVQLEMRVLIDDFSQVTLREPATAAQHDHSHP